MEVHATWGQKNRFFFVSIVKEKNIFTNRLPKLISFSYSTTYIFKSKNIPQRLFVLTVFDDCLDYHMYIKKND